MGEKFFIDYHFICLRCETIWISSVKLREKRSTFFVLIQCLCFLKNFWNNYGNDCETIAKKYAYVLNLINSEKISIH